MIALNRSYLPPEDEARLTAQHERILVALKEKPQTNVSLARLAMDYCRAVRVLRKRGHSIRSLRLDNNGLWLYTLLPKPDPMWAVELRTTFPDGHVHVHTH